MENASRAVVMAGTILIGVLLLSLLAYLFTQGSAFNQEYNKTMSDREITAFNTKFEKYLGKSYMNGDEVISVLKLVQDSNERIEAGITIKVTATGTSIPTLRHDTSNDDQVDFLTKYKNSVFQTSGSKIDKKYIFTCEKIEYDEVNGRIKNIVIEGEYKDLDENGEPDMDT